MIFLAPEQQQVRPVTCCVRGRSLRPCTASAGQLDNATRARLQSFTAELKGLRSSLFTTVLLPYFIYFRLLLIQHE